MRVVLCASAKAGRCFCCSKRSTSAQPVFILMTERNEYQVPARVKLSQSATPRPLEKKKSAGGMFKSGLCTEETSKVNVNRNKRN